jgi:uncharacterized protein
VIIEHSYSLGLKPSSIESAILQDADRIDALGAIGIMRATTCGTKLGSNYYEPSDPFAIGRELNDKQFTIDHYYVKLLKLADSMNTGAGKNEAENRTEYMKDFLKQLDHEIHM